MDWNTMRKIAREKFSGACRVCPICNGVACAGEVPGMGGLGTGSSFHNNFTALADYRLNLRTQHAINKPVIACNILGMELSMPVIGAAIAGIDMSMNSAMTEDEYNEAVVKGCWNSGTICMTGDGHKPTIFESGLKALKTAKGWGIPILKPRETDKIVALAKTAAEAGAPAFGVDVDAAALVHMTKAGQPVGPKTVRELEAIKRQTTIPFIVKSVMTSDEALGCVEAGVDAIVVSNHGGRALDYTPGTAEVLPHIAKAVKGKITILVDGGIRSGADVLKMLALGADAVLIGRLLAIGAVGGGSEGVQMVLNKFATELEAAMVLTGTANVAAVSDDVIWQQDK